MMTPPHFHLAVQISDEKIASAIHRFDGGCLVRVKLA
jgi:hypothetical protein